MNLQRLKRIYGRIGVTCWLLIVPAKLVRRFDGLALSALIDVAPSLLGPAGLVLVLLSNAGRWARLTISQALLVTAGIALAAEFVQLVPIVRPLYRFDWLDVAATLVSVAAGALLAAVLRRRLQPS